MLERQGNAAAGAHLQQLQDSQPTFDPLLLETGAHAMESRQPSIVTGTYAPGANDLVSRLELLKSEIEHGHFTRALVKGLIRTGEIKTDEVSAMLCGPVGEFFAGAEGAETAAYTCSAVGRGILSNFELDILSEAAIVRLVLGRFAGLVDRQIAAQVQKSAREAEAKGIAQPTHSQLAKDAPDHIGHNIARRLAIHAARNMGIAMAETWREKGNPVAVQNVTGLVDVYVSDPARELWWREVVAESLGGPI
jgi:hypothetical protein